jgi:uncharacterized protein DUF4276
VTSEIRVYVEGGGDGKDTRSLVKKGFRSFLNGIAERGRLKRLKFYIIACGSIQSTIDDFNTALRTHPNAFNVLLVDSDGPVESGVLQHLLARGGSTLAGIVGEDNCHLMVQVVEAWLVADLAALQQFYGQRFNSNSIPKNPNVEELDKNTLYSSLKSATRMTQKGEYHKTRHGPELLKRVDVSKVRRAAPYCERLLSTLEQRIDTV